MIETIVWTMIASTSVGTLVAAHLQYLVVRRNKAIAEKKALPAPVSQEMRDEIEQNEAWWLRSFHALMERSGASVIGLIHGMEYTETYRGSMRYGRTPDRKALEGCICSECARIMAEVRRPATNVTFGNPVLVAEIQRAYGQVPDGLAGPRTLGAIRTGWTTIPLSPEARQLIEHYKGAGPEVRTLPANVTQMSRGGVTMTNALPGRRVDWEAEVAYWTNLDRKRSRKRA
ncbi:hypothetical protein SEA_BIG4_275 [Microbacterium phage Big4]|nr:hypothetical protein SEA_BIG4_275 [Microbacterium phage Big4]